MIKKNYIVETRWKMLVNYRMCIKFSCISTSSKYLNYMVFRTQDKQQMKQILYNCAQHIRRTSYETSSSTEVPRLTRTRTMPVQIRFIIPATKTFLLTLKMVSVGELQSISKITLDNLRLRQQSELTLQGLTKTST